MCATDAVQAPRLHWDDDCVQIEPGFAPAALEALEQRWRINPWRVRDIYFGGVHAVAPLGEGAGDPRRGGCAEVMD
jgi:gamma-glutamyltranspeptidase/glutathione hydrolase